MSSSIDDYPDHDDECDPDTLGNQCPVCDCHGSIVVYHSIARDWDTGEYTDTSEIVCETCQGGGYLTETLTEDAVRWDGRRERRMDLTR